MTKNYEAQVVIPHDNGMARDAAVNSFSFLGPDVPTDIQANELRDRLIQFYGTAQAPGTNTPLIYMANTMNGAGGRLKIYRREDAAPRAPLFDLALNIGSPSGTPGPHELSCVLSFQAPKVSGLSQRRRRGRIFFGPLSTAAYSGVANEDSRIVPGLRDTLRGAAIGLFSEANTDWIWGVWSSITGHATVTNGWVDNAVDVQRRRGLKATVRDLWPVP